MIRFSRPAELVGQGARQIGQMLRPPAGTWDQALERWGWWLLLLFGLAPILVAMNLILHPLLWGQNLGNPFTMAFPIQAGEMATAMMTSPLTIFPLLVSFLFGRMRQQGVPVQPGPGLMGPIFLASLFSVSLLQSVYLYQEANLLVVSGAPLDWGPVLVHFVRNILLHGVWILLFLIVSIHHPGAGIGLTASIFFGLQGLLFARGFVPHFGILDLAANHFLGFSHQGSSAAAMFASLVKMVFDVALIGLLWAVFQKQIEKLAATTHQPTVPPPLPAEAREQ